MHSTAFDERAGVGKKNLDNDPSIRDNVQNVLDSTIAGNPQQPDVAWTHLSAGEISRRLEHQVIQVSEYTVNKVYDELHLGVRQMSKLETMKEVENRDEQFRHIAVLRAAFLGAGLPVLSMDTKKKEQLGNFFRPGKGYGSTPLKVYDHDFVSFSEGCVVPHGLYDEEKNRGYISLGLSKDTSEFMLDNIFYWWKEELQWVYPEAKAMLLLCDGGGSNGSRNHIVKHDLYRLSKALGVTIVVAHYPPYCSKWNPIEHRLFSELTRAWQGQPFLNLQIVKELAQKTSTSTGLSVKARVNQKKYLPQRKAPDDFFINKDNYVKFSENLSNWNYWFTP